MDNHKDEKPVFISGKQVRETLLEGRGSRSPHHAPEHVAHPRGRDVPERLTGTHA